MDKGRIDKFFYSIKTALGWKFKRFLMYEKDFQKDVQTQFFLKKFVSFFSNLFLGRKFIC